MKIETIDIDKLIPYHNNPRKDQAVDKVASSINEYGFQQPIVVDKNMVLIVGHTRLLGAKKLGLKQVPVHIADLSEAKAKAYRIADNRLNEDSNWDFDLLNLEVKSLLEENYDIDLLGFDSNEIDKFLKNDEQYLTDEDEVPEPPKEPITKLGDIWELETHKLICGDSTEPSVLEKIFDKNKADMILTDPPYNVNYGTWKGDNKNGNRFKQRTIENDNMSEEEFKEFLQTFIINSFDYVKDGSPFYIFYGERNALQFLSAFKNSGLYHSCNIIWKKHALVLGRADYHYIHEPIFYGWKDKTSHKFYGDRKGTSVWEFDRPMKSDLHPTMKPVSLLEKAIKNSSKSEDIIYEPFCGSGSTLIACEKTNRICYGVELDPKYCDIIIKRWENFAGKKAKLLNG